MRHIVRRARPYVDVRPLPWHQGNDRAQSRRAKSTFQAPDPVHRWSEGNRIMILHSSSFSEAESVRGKEGRNDEVKSQSG